jgi:hypothetical protein
MSSPPSAALRTWREASSRRDRLGSVVASPPMTFTRQEARSLCTKPELDLVAASDGKTLEELTLARVQSKLQRARTLRDKFRDLERSQRLEARGKPSPRRRAPRSEGAVRTARKAEIFAIVTSRFEARAAELQTEIDQGKRLAKPPASATAARAPRAADPPAGQSKKGHRRSRRRAVSQAIEGAPNEDVETLEEMQLPKGTRSTQRRLARKPPKKKAAKKKAAKKKAATEAATEKKTAKKTATKKKAATKKKTAKEGTTKKAAKKKAAKRGAAKKAGKAKKTKVAPVSPEQRSRVARHSIKQMSGAKGAGRRKQARRDKR